MRMANISKCCQASGGDVIIVPDSPVEYDDIVLRSMVGELDDLDIPVPPTMAPQDQLSPQDITPENSPSVNSVYSVERYHRSKPFSPSSDSLDTLDSWELPGFRFEM